MTTPRLLGGGTNRYLHKRGHKVKKRDSSRKQSKDVRSQSNNHPPRITQKRLTNKSGFCFKGALNTSPHLRGSKAGRENQKPKRGSADFDLFCLLKAAKSKISTGQPPPASGSTSSLLDSSCTFVGSVEDSNGKINPSKTKTYHIPEIKRRGESKPQSSSESHVSSMADNHRKRDMQHILSNACDPYHDDCDINNQGGGLRNASPTIEHPQFTTKKVDDRVPQARAPQAMLRSCSLSSYQKFAVRIVQAMLPEKKRQFPSQGWLATAGEELSNIYNKTYSKQHNERLGKTEHTLPGNHTTVEINQHIATKPGKIDREECFKSKKVPVKCEEPSRTHAQEDKLFKEKSVKAWVDAISESVPTNELCEGPTNIYPSNQNNKLSNSTEMEFLKNFMDNTPGFKAVPIKVGSVPFQTRDDTGLFSPFAPPIPKQSLKSQRIVMPESIREQPQGNTRHSRAPWFTGKMEHHIEERVSPISPGFLFGPPIPPLRKANHLDQVSNKAMKPDKNDDGLFSWSIFSKHPKLDKHQVSLPTHPKINYCSQHNKDLETIRFSPRFMF